MSLDFTRAKLAKIAAFQLSTGNSAADVADYLRSVAPGAEEGEIERGLLEGRRAVSLSAALTGGQQQSANILLGLLGGQAAKRWDVLIHFQTVVGGETVWRSTTFSAPQGATPQSIGALAAEKMRALEAAALERAATKGDTWTGEIIRGSLSYGYVVPLLEE